MKTMNNKFYLATTVDGKVGLFDPMAFDYASDAKAFLDIGDPNDENGNPIFIAKGGKKLDGMLNRIWK